MLVEKKPISKKFYWWTFKEIQKFGRKMKNFKNFFDVHMDASVIVNNIKKKFKIVRFEKIHWWTFEERTLTWPIFD